MEAIILAGGLGTRLSSVISGLPKPMAAIGKKPFLEILLTSLAKKKFKRCIFSLGYQADSIIRYFGSNFSGIAIDYVVEEKPLGTGGGLRLALTRVEKDHVFVFNGDTYLDLEIELVESQWRARKKPIIVGCKVPDSARYGQLLIEDNKVIGFTEKGRSAQGLINAGSYVFTKDQLNAFSVGEVFSLEMDYLIPYAVSNSFDFFETTGLFIDIGVPEDYELAQALLKDS